MTYSHTTGKRITIAKRRLVRGYTIVELMLSLAVLAVGAAGIITMQRVTAESNRHAKALVTATHLAQSWLDQLTADSSQWQLNNFTETDWLGNIGTATSTDWIRPVYVQTRNWGPSFDFTGKPVVNPVSPDVFFCTDLRLQRLYPEATADVPGSGLIRAEVRVYWLRDSTVPLATSTANGPCSPTWSEDLITNGAESDRAFHFVYMSTALLQHEI